MAMSLGGIGATHPVTGSSEPLAAAAAPGLTKRERKRKSDAKANAAANSGGLPANAGGHSFTRDERKALALGLPITVQVSSFAQALVADSLSTLRSNF